MLAHMKPMLPLIQKLRFQFLASHKVPFIRKMGNTKSSDPHAELISDYPKFVQDLVKDNCIFVFSKSGCPYCSRVRQIFQENKVDYFAWMDLDGRSDGDKIQQVLEDMTGARTVPRVFINGECIGGASETEKLHKANKLMEKIQDCRDKQSDE